MIVDWIFRYVGQLIADFDEYGNILAWGGNPILMDQSYYEGK